MHVFSIQINVQKFDNFSISINTSYHKLSSSKTVPGIKINIFEKKNIQIKIKYQQFVKGILN